MSKQEAFATYLELRESTPDGEQAAGLSHTSEGLVLVHVMEVAAYGEPRGIVTIVHDAGDHGGRYEDLAHVLAEKDFAVALPDLRGHGRSEGPRGHSNGLREVERDLEEVQNHLAYRLPEAPKILVGIGLGALYCANYAIEKPGEIAGLCLVAPLCDPKFTLPEAKKGLMGMFAKKVGPTSEGSIGWSADRLTGDASEASKLGSDDKRHDLITVRAANQAAEAAKKVSARLGEVSVPKLVLVGDADDIAPTAGVKALGGGDVKSFAGQKHDLFHDTERSAVQAELLGWLESL